MRQGESSEKVGRETRERLKNWGMVRLSGISREPAPMDMVVTKELAVCPQLVYLRRPRQGYWSHQFQTQPCVRNPVPQTIKALQKSPTIPQFPLFRYQRLRKTQLSYNGLHISSLHGG